jgi:hypothetical protein
MNITKYDNKKNLSQETVNAVWWIVFTEIIHAGLSV